MDTPADEADARKRTLRVVPGGGGELGPDGAARDRARSWLHLWNHPRLQPGLDDEDEDEDEVEVSGDGEDPGGAPPAG